MAEQIQARTLEQLRNADAQNYERYLGCRVVIEENELGNPVSEAILARNGENSVYLEDYTKWGATIENIQNKGRTERLKPHFRLAKRTVAKSQIASMQLLEDVLLGRTYNEVFQK